MKDLTNDFLTAFCPKMALVFYQKKGRDSETYVEFFDMDKNGYPVNAHPLTVNEAKRLAKALNTEDDKKLTMLRPSGVLQSNILYIDQTNSKAVWFTKAQPRMLFFTNSLGIPNGVAIVPPMLWVGDRNSLSVFALASDRRPTGKSKLYDAPFFNIYANGNVCMGTVDVTIKETASLEEFTTAWENYFFNSYFSHLMGGHVPINGNCVLLWESLVNTEKRFPMEVLKPSKRTLKELMR